MFDPFDFSDFGSPRTPGGTLAFGSTGQGSGGRTALPPSGLGSGLGTGFDPFAEAPAQPAQPRDAFGATKPGTNGATVGLTVARPPLALFGLAIALAAAGMATAAVWGGSPTAAALGWFLAGPAAIGVLATYTRVDTRRRTNVVYSAPSWSGALYWAVVAVCMIGIGIGAWHLALWAGRQ